MIREKGLPLSETRRLIIDLKRAYPSAKCLLNWQGSFEVNTLPIDGIHLSVEAWKKLYFKINDLQNAKVLQNNLSLAIHSYEEWLEAYALGYRPTYILISPVFETTCKPGVVPLGLGQARELSLHIHKDEPKIKVVGLGGFNFASETLCMKAGLDGFAMRSGFFV